MLIPGKQFEYDVLYKDAFSGDASKFGNVNLYQIGELYCSGGYIVPEHKQFCHEITYVVNGKGVFTTDDNEYELDEGSINFSPLGSRHSIRVPEDSNLRYVYIGFDFKSGNIGTDMEKLKKFFLSLSNFSAIDKGHNFLTVLKVLDEIYNSTEFYEKMVQTYMEQVLIAVYRAFTNCQLNSYQHNGSSDLVKHTIFSVTKYIERNIYENISVMSIAEKVGYSYAYLSNLFKKNMGITIQQYISNKKIEKAIELSEVDKLSFVKIADKLGYANLQSFNKAFKRTKGCAPTEYVKSLKGENTSQKSGERIINESKQNL